jgi:hypothetical protein
LLARRTALTKAAPTKGTATRHRKKSGNAGQIAPAQADLPAGSETDSSITPAATEQSHQQTRKSTRRADEDTPVSPTPAIPTMNVSAHAAAPASLVPILRASFGLNRVPEGVDMQGTELDDVTDMDPAHGFLKSRDILLEEHPVLNKCTFETEAIRRFLRRHQVPDRCGL